MSILDRFIAAVTPRESAEARPGAWTKVNRAAVPGDWPDKILQHHMDIAGVFGDVKAASDARARIAASRH